MRRIIATLVLLVPTLAYAQSGVELTPSFGFRWGGKLYAEDSSLLTHDVEVQSSDTWGLNLNFPVNEHFQIELLASKQSTQFGNENGLFEQSSDHVDVDISYAHIGMLWQWPVNDWAPYIATSIGVGHIDPNLRGATAEDRFSASFAWGFKLRLADHVGLRIEQRGYWTDLSSWNSHNNHNDHHHDNNHDCYYDDCNTHDLLQAAVTAGIVIRF
jgi:hypothetical protein